MTDICSELNVEPMSQEILLDYFVYAEPEFIEECVNELKEWNGYKFLKSIQDQHIVGASHFIEIHKAEKGILMRYGTFTQTLEHYKIGDPPWPRDSHRAVLYSEWSHTDENVITIKEFANDSQRNEKWTMDVEAIGYDLNVSY